MSTIFALSSGRPPAAIAVVRVSGPAAQSAAHAMTGGLPRPRNAALRTVRGRDGAPLDRALVMFFPGPHSATGEDLLEFHLHGGRAVIAAVEATLAALPGLRRAQPGEFTRRSLENGRIDLAQAHGLADLLEAETESQRRIALAAADGAVGRMIETWLDAVSAIAARVEAELDFANEADVATAATFDVIAAITDVAAEIDTILARSSVERIGDGIRVVLAGPRNAGKSSLFNALLGRDAAIVTPVAGTTRDILEAGVTRAGIPYRLTDTAGLTGQTDDVVERIGIDRARVAIDTADLLLWLGDAADRPPGAVRVRSKSDLLAIDDDAEVLVSAFDAASVERLWNVIADRSAALIGAIEDVHLHETQRAAVGAAASELRAAIAGPDDLLLVAEQLRVASRHLAGVIGRHATEAMLDALFGRFCLGK